MADYRNGVSRVKNAEVPVFGEGSKSITLEEVLQRTANTLEHFSPGYGDNTISMGVINNVKKWAEAKKPLYDLLSNHPDWNPDTLAVESTISRDRTYSRDRSRNMLQNFMRFAINDGKITSDDSDEFRTQMFRLKFLNTTSISKGTLELYNKRVEAGTLHSILQLQKPVVGQKTTRYLRAILIKHGIDVENTVYRAAFGHLCDTFSDTSEEFKFVLSLDPSAFLTMSNGNSWESCHNLNGGCYRRGTLSYMNDETTVMTFVVPKNWDIEAPERRSAAAKILSTTPKYYRRAVMFDTDAHTIMQSRIYPGADNREFAAAYSAKVEEIFKVALAASGVEVTYQDGNGNWSSYFDRYDRAHYPDFSYGECNIRVTSDKTVSRANIKNIGGINYCVNCGYEFHYHATAETVYCDDCYDECDRDWDDDDDDDGDY